MPDDPKPSGGEPPKPDDVQAELARTKEELESVRGKVKKYSDEAAAARVARKQEYEDKITELEAKLKGKDDDGTPTPKPTDAEAAKLRAEIADLRKKDEDRDKREKDRDVRELEDRHRLAASELVARHKLEAPDDAVELLIGRTKLAEDGKTLTFTAKDKDTQAPVDIALTSDNFESSGLLPTQLWPAKGNPGGGGRPPKEMGDATGVDMSRVADRTYWKKHKEKILEGSGVK